MTTRYLILLTLFVSFTTTEFANAQSDVFWSGRSEPRISQATVDATSFSDTFFTSLAPIDIATDPTNGKVYWADLTETSIRRANFDGTTGEEVIKLTASTQLLDLDLIRGKLYWVEGAVFKRANTDGTNVETLFTNISTPLDFAIDSGNGKIYYTNGATGDVRSVNFDGSNDTQILGAQGNTTGIDIDNTNDKIYFSDTTADEIRSADLDGMNLVTIINVGLNNVARIDVDEVNSKVYWSDDADNEVERSDLDGMNRLTQAGFNTPRGVGVDGTNSKVFVANVTVNNLLQSANLDFTGVASFTGPTFFSEPQAVAVNKAGNKVYWVDVTGNTIEQADLDGTNQTTLIAGLTSPRGLGLDISGNKIYFSDNNMIRRANLSDGMSLENLVTTGVLAPQHLVVDTLNSKVYWTDFGAGSISRANLDGTSVEAVISTGLSSPRGLSIDLVNAKLYWSDSGSKKVQRSNLDGTSIEDLLTGLTMPLGVAIDVDNSKLYLAEEGLGKVIRSDLDGMNMEDFAAPALSKPVAIAIVDNNNPTAPSIASPSANSDVSTLPTISGTAEALSSVQIFQGMAMLGTTSADIMGNWTFTPGMPLTVGTAVYTAKALDIAGNTSAASSNTALTVETPVFATTANFLWNGFLDLQNVVTLINKSTDTSVNVTATLKDSEGMTLSTTPLVIPPRGDLEVIVNGLSNFAANSAGVLQLAFDQNTVDGTAFYYRFAADGSSEISMGTTLQQPLTGESFVPFNTIQPSAASAEVNNQVLNWLQVANTDTVMREFTVELYDQAGSTMLSTNTINVPAMGRRDVPAGHQFMGQNVGLARIVPTTMAAPYIAQITRFGADALSGQPTASYSFGLLLQARQGLASKFYAPISNGGGALNFVVVANAGMAGTVEAAFYANSGTLLDTQTATLGQYGQEHLFATALLGAGESGFVELTPMGGASVISESTFYFRNPANGSVTASYASEGRQVSGHVSNASYNFFLGNFDYLKVFNNSMSDVEIMITLDDQSGTSLGTEMRTVSAQTGIDIGVHEFSFAPGPNTVGNLTLETNSAGAIVAEMLRLNSSADGTIDSIESLPTR